MSVQSEITRLETAKEAIISAITEKGVTVPSGAKLPDLGPLIAAIEAGGGGGSGGGFASLGDLDEVTTGSFTPSAAVIAEYAVNLGIPYKNTYDSLVFLVFSAPRSFVRSGTFVNSQVLFTFSMRNYRRANNAASKHYVTRYASTSGVLSTTTSWGDFGTSAKSAYGQDEELKYFLDCTTSITLPANMPYYWIAGVKRI